MHYSKEDYASLVKMDCVTHSKQLMNNYRVFEGVGGCIDPTGCIICGGPFKKNKDGVCWGCLFDFPTKAQKSRDTKQE